MTTHDDFLWKVEEPSLKIKLTCIRSSETVLLKAIMANFFFFFFPEDKFENKLFFLFVQHVIFLKRRKGNNGLIATSFLHLYCNYLW